MNDYVSECEVNTKIYEEGFEAGVLFTTSKVLTENPYVLNKDKSNLWEKGFYNCKYAYDAMY